jgi:hypothetical protein
LKNGIQSMYRSQLLEREIVEGGDARLGRRRRAVLFPAAVEAVLAGLGEAELRGPCRWGADAAPAAAHARPRCARRTPGGAPR